MIIFLVGFMGCGKSTTGRRLAERLGYAFADTDTLVAERCGKSVAEIFASEGEEFFRRNERKAIEDLPSEGDLVVATGGGAPCHADNMEQMLRKGKAVYLRMSPANLTDRLLHARSVRPKIAGMNPTELLAYVTDTLAERELFYRKAQIVIDCNGVDESYVIDHLRRILSER